jgi:hypothetical protein
MPFSRIETDPTTSIGLLPNDLGFGLRFSLKFSRRAADTENKKGVSVDAIHDALNALMVDVERGDRCILAHVRRNEGCNNGVF